MDNVEFLERHREITQGAIDVALIHLKNEEPHNARKVLQNAVDQLDKLREERQHAIEVKKIAERSWHQLTNTLKIREDY